MSYSDFKAKRVTRSYCQSIHASPDTVFSLLCPAKEKEWLEGWDYTMIYSESGYGEDDCVFLSHQAGEKDTIWLITERDIQNKKIVFARITPDSRATRVAISVKGKDRDRASSVYITYTVTALSEEGNRFIERFTEGEFNKMMQFWEKSLNTYLETGKKLKRSSDK